MFVSVTVEEGHAERGGQWGVRDRVSPTGACEDALWLRVPRLTGKGLGTHVTLSADGSWTTNTTRSVQLRTGNEVWDSRPGSLLSQGRKQGEICAETGVKEASPRALAFCGTLSVNSEEDVPLLVGWTSTEPRGRQQSSEYRRQFNHWNKRDDPSPVGRITRHGDPEQSPQGRDYVTTGGEAIRAAFGGRGPK